ncbi:MAG: hypothetical protein ACRDTG_18610, partial [Pseudonocardiaceae bacterium]
MGGGTNSALRGLLDEAEMSNTGLARAVVHAGAREGIHLGTDTTAVKRMLDGAQVTHLRQLDCRYGSGRTRVRVVQLLNHEANELLHGSYSEKIGRALLPAVAKAAWLAGFTAGDVGRHSLGQRYYIQALNLAMAGGDRLYAGYLLSQMSRMTQGIARGIVTEFDRVRHARQSVVLARAGLALTQGVATPLLVTQLHVAEGRGLALLGEVTATRRAMREAEQHHERVHPGAEPPWLSLYTDASLAADLGRCLRDIGEP